MINRLSRYMLILLLCVPFWRCSDDVETCVEESEEVGGPTCCSGGCGNSTEGWLPRVCRGGEWVCQGSGVLQEACAYQKNACITLSYCGGSVGINKEEPDPAADLCCDLSCKGNKMMHRVCKDGLRFECPAGAVPISRCKDYKTACRGGLEKYRQNNYKIPDELK